MITCSFYTEKGGTGKTTFSILFSSWCAYVRDLRVGVIDLDCPAHHLHETRKREERLLGILSPEDGEFARASYLRRHSEGLRPYDIVRMNGLDPSVMDQVVSYVEYARKNDAYDVMVFDFPGSFRGQDASVRIIGEGLLDRMFCPVRLDEKEISGISRFSRTVRSLRGDQFMRLFWNFVGRNESKAKYAEFREVFSSLGFDMSPTVIPNLVAMRRESEEGAFCSTLYFPESLVRRRMPEALELFNEILDSFTKDISGNGNH